VPSVPATYAPGPGIRAIHLPKTRLFFGRLGLVIARSESDEAIQDGTLLDCFATLAMTQTRVFSYNGLAKPIFRA
jgi:hypothetical protein